MTKQKADVNGWIVGCSYKDELGIHALSVCPDYTNEAPYDGTVTVRLRQSLGKNKFRQCERTVTVKEMVRFCNGCLGAIQADHESYTAPGDGAEPDEEYEEDDIAPSA